MLAISALMFELLLAYGWNELCFGDASIDGHTHSTERHKNFEAESQYINETKDVESTRIERSAQQTSMAIMSYV